jgi:hypothetical protein
MLVMLLTVVALFASLSAAYAQDPEDAVAAPTGGATSSVGDASCIQPDPAQNVCYVNADVDYTNPDNNVGITLTLGLSDEDVYSHPVVANYRSYADLYISYDRNGLGFQVPCGEANPPGGKMGFDYQLTAWFTGGGGTPVRVTCPAYDPGVPTAVGANSFSATLDRLAPYQGFIVALVVGAGLLVNVLVPARLRQWRKRIQ